MGLGRSLLLQPGPAAGLRTLQAASDLARRRLTIIAAAAWRSDARSSPAEGSAHTAAAAGRAATAAPLAAPGSSAALAAAGSAAPADAHAPLGTDDLRRFIEQHGIAAAVVPPLNGALPPAPDCCEVKSLLFLADGQPLVLVLPLEARVDERALAALLHTGRNRVRLAPLDSLVPLCGYTVGNVPPFGHRHRLPVIVDASVTAFASCYAGGGSEESEIALSVAELLRATGATVAEIAKAGSLGSSSLASSSSGSSLSSALDSSSGVEAPPAAAENAAAEQQQVPAAATAALPLPWQPGEVEVTLEGVVAHRRKIARLLLFANLVPLSALERTAAAPPPKPGAAAFVRRLWRHPNSQQPTEVQLILGKTLERNLGSEGMAQLLRGVKAGQCVRVVGRVQPHVAKAGAPAEARTDICDVVVTALTLIDAPPAPAAAPPAAPGSAQQLARAAAAPGAAPAAPAAACYALPAEVERAMLLVDSEAGLAQLEAALFPSPPAGACAEAAAVGSGAKDGQPRGFGPPGSPYRLVVGLDAEWQPYSSRLGQERTPVSLLQLATPDAVFLLDMLALAASPADCSSDSSSSGGDSSPAGPSTAAPQDGSGGDGEQAPPPPVVLSAAQRRLSDVLARLFGDAGIIKAGFGLGNDLQRLAESYPSLACFGAQGPVPLRSHVDVLLLARTALGSALPHGRRRLSLSALAQAVLGRDIDKTEQCSDWAARPLRREQLLYAAADAHALVAMHRELHRRRAGLDSPFWVSHFSGKLTDVAAFHPRTQRSSASSSDRSASSGSGVRRSAGSWRERRGAREVAGGGAAPLGRSPSQSQTLQLDVNIDYLLNSYLGRHLPQGGKAAAVRAAAAHTGRAESGQTPRFPRGCGGLLEWRNAFLLFVNLPESGEQPAGGRSYPNQFLWLPPAGGEAAAAAEPLRAAGVDAALQAGRRLAMTWWPSRGQSLDNPVVQRLLAAGRTSAAAPWPAEEQAAGGEGSSSSSPSGTSSSGASEQPAVQQNAVLLFCRAGGGSYAFCGRLLPAGVGSPPAVAADAGGGGGGAAGAGTCITWELADGAALLRSDAFRRMLFG